MRTIKLKKQGPFYRYRVSPEFLGSCSLFLMLCSDLVWSVIFHAGKIVGLGEDDKVIFVALQGLITLSPCFLSAAIYHKVKKSGFFILFPVCLMLFLLSAEIHPEYRTWIFAGNWDIWTTIFAPSCGLWMFLYVQLCDNSDRLFRIVVNASRLNFAYAFVRFARVLLIGTTVVFKSRGETYVLDYDMSLGYMVVFCAAIFLYKCLQKMNLLDLMCLVASVIIIVFGGSRGAFGLLGLTFLVFSFEFRKKLLNNKFVLILCSLSTMLLITCVIFIKEIQSFLLNIIEKYDIHSRTLTMLISGQITWDNGRNVIKDAAVQLIKNGGLFGHGVYGDRYVLVNVQDAGYPHNIYYEMAVQFGPILAVLLLTFIGVIIIVTLSSCKDRYFRAIYLAFLISSGKLLVSDSFWYNKYFWGLLGLTLLYWRKTHMKAEMLLDLT